MRTAAQAIKWMSNHHEGRAGMCLWTVQEAYQGPHAHPNAANAWHAESGKHHGDSPPRGGIVWWTGGSHGYGHIAIALGDDMILSTDLPRWGSIGRVHLHTPRTSWGLHYAGWSDHLDNIPIHGIGGHHEKRKDIYVSKLRYGQRHSDSVKALQHRLNQILKLNETHHHLQVDGNYSAHTDYRVREWQRKIGDKPDKEHRSSLGPKQAAKMFGKKYRIHN